MKPSADSVEHLNHRPQGLRTESRGSRPAVTTEPAGVEHSRAISAETELSSATAAYHAWVASRLDALLIQVNYLSSDLLGQSGIADAKHSWLAAHMTYESLGTAKRAFGPLDRAINASIAGDGTDASGDTSATGFHKVEALLWSGAHMAEVKEAVGALRTLVVRLVRQFQSAKVHATTIPAGLPKVIEAAIQAELTGLTDAGSHSSLATISANLGGVTDALSFIEPLLEPRYSKLRETRAELASSEALVKTFARGGDWVPLDDLTSDERDRLEGSLQALLGLLKPIAGVCRGMR